MTDRPIKQWVTINGRHVPIYEKSTVSDKQLKYEETIRDKKQEQGAYLDKDGNVLMEVQGDEDQIAYGGENDWDTSVQFNHEVEQRVWKNEEVNFTHNHPEDTIFSPEDIESFEALENHSLSAVLPNGTTYRIIREQPRTSNEWVINEKTGELERKFEPKKIAEAYYEAYSEVYDEGYKKLPWKGDPDRKRLEAELDRKVADAMEDWLNKNAKQYGYRFEIER